MLQLLSMSYGFFCPFYKTDNDKGKKADKSAQYRVKRVIYTAQSTRLRGTLAGCLFNQSSQPSYKKRLIIVIYTYGFCLFSFLSTCQAREKGDVQSYTVQERFSCISKK